jgi:hypothetical protein
VLLTSAENAALRLGAHTMRLDTRHDRTAVRGPYAAHGYAEIAPYSAGLHTDHWYEKRLRAEPR